jgi:NADPH2:quinone reductase
MRNDMNYGAYKFSATGGPDVLTWTDVEVAAPGADDILIEHAAIGVNYIDIYHRTGLYPLPLPSGIGVEGAGIVRAVGSNVSFVKEGDRVAYAGGPPGAYSTGRLVPAGRVVKIPDAVSFEVAAALLFKGLTAQYLTHAAYPVKAGETVLLHAAAGGVGRIALQMLKHIGATVIAVVSTDAKADVATGLGADHVIIDTEGTFAPKVREIVPGGVDVVYDSVGRTTFTGSLDSLRQRGMMVSFGTSSGTIAPNDGGILGAKGSLYFTRPSIAHYMARRDQLEPGAESLFAMLTDGIVTADSITPYPLSDAAKAQADLEARKTIGSLVLTV